MGIFISIIFLYIGWLLLGSEVLNLNLETGWLRWVWSIAGLIISSGICLFISRKLEAHSVEDTDYPRSWTWKK